MYRSSLWYVTTNSDTGFAAVYVSSLRNHPVMITALAVSSQRYIKAAVSKTVENTNANTEDIQAENVIEVFSFGMWVGCQMLGTNETQGLPVHTRLSNRI